MRARIYNVKTDRLVAARICETAQELQDFLKSYQIFIHLDALESDIRNITNKYFTRKA